jgi:Peptidase MA superfamily
LAYGESYLVTQFILDQYGEDAIQAIIAAYRNGASHDDVLRDALGLTIEGLEQAWLGELASNWRGDQVA